MHFFLKLLALTAHASALVLPRAEQPCPHHEPSADPADQYIVRLHDDHTLDNHFEHIGMDLSNGTDVFHSLEVLHSYRATLTEEFVHNIIRYDPGVHSVTRGSFIDDEEALDQDHEDEHVKQPAGKPEGKGLSGIFQRAVRWTKIKRKGWYHLQEITAGKKMDLKRREEVFVPMLRTAGEGVDIYILDSGIFTRHLWFEGRAKNFRGETETKYTIRVPGGTTTVNDDDSHGTHVAGLAGGLRHGVAQWATLVNVKVTCRKSSECRSSTAGIIHALNDILEDHNKNKERKKKNQRDPWRGSVINLSFAIGDESDELTRVLQKVYEAGIPIAVAAGNFRASDSNKKARGTLCRSPHTICVGATDSQYKKLDISGDGKEVNIWAPGDDLPSAHNKEFANQRWKTGTSQAAPLVAGTMAIFVGYEEIIDSAQSVYNTLNDNQLNDILSGLSDPWFWGEKENNCFLQTGITQPPNSPSNQPYKGPPGNYNPPHDRPPGLKARATVPTGARRDVAPEIDAPPDKDFKNTKVEPAGENSPMVITQELTLTDETDFSNAPLDPIYYDEVPADTAPENSKPTRFVNVILEENLIGIAPFSRTEMKWLFYTFSAAFGISIQDSIDSRCSLNAPSSEAPADGVKDLKGSPFPAGSFKFTTGDGDCEYKNDGTGNPGAVWCAGTDFAHNCIANTGLNKYCDQLVKANTGEAKQITQRIVADCNW